MIGIRMAFRRNAIENKNIVAGKLNTKSNMRWPHAKIKIKLY